MKTKEDFQAVIANSIANYPTAAQFYQAGDPRLLASLDAMAAMLAMVSAEMDVASMEPFTKARDVTVLADAAMKGVLPFGTCGRFSLLVENTATSPLTINAGRRLLDGQGRAYVVEQGATIPAEGSGNITAVQQYERTIVQTVRASRAFFKIEIPAPEAGRHIASVRIADDNGNEFEYVPEFVNVSPEQRTFHLESDESRALFAVFGANNIAGYQPQSGEVLNVTVIDTDGEIEIEAGAKLAFEYSYSLFEAGASVSFAAVLSPGRNPHDIATMRELSKYPSIYDSSAVFLGNFDFLVRRSGLPFLFLSIWNEQTEEEVRGADIDNMNCLFIAAEADGVEQATLRQQITRIIKKADDSYRLRFVDVAHSPITVAITGRVSPIYDFAAVRQQVIDKIIPQYGPLSAFAKRGGARVLYKKLYDLLKEVQAFQGEESDLDITITDPDASILPEHYRYISEASLTVTINEL